MSVVSRYLEPALVERLNHLQLSARSVVEGTTIGSHKSPVKGASIEFRQHRAYVPGDEPKRLDWRVLGRTDRPYIKEYDEETNLRCVLMLDCSGSMGYGEGTKWGSKFDYAARLAVSLAYLMLGQTESVGLCLFQKKINDWLAPHTGTGQLSRVVEAIEKVAPKGESALAGAVHETAERLDRRALVVLDRDEIEFPFRNWTRFRGLEGEAASLCEPSLVRKSYRENQKRHARELDEASRMLRGELQTFVTDKPLADSLPAFLHHRLAR